MIMTNIMIFLWELHDLTGFPPFEWAGNWIEDNFEHELSDQVKAAIEESRKEYELHQPHV